MKFSNVLGNVGSLKREWISNFDRCRKKYYSACQHWCEFCAAKMTAALSEEVVEKVNAKQQIYFLIVTVSNYQEDTFMFAKE